MRIHNVGSLVRLYFDIKMLLTGLYAIQRQRRGIRWEAKRDTAVASRTAFSGLIALFPGSTAVSPMQGALASLPPHSRDASRIMMGNTCLISGARKHGQLCRARIASNSFIT